MYGVGCRLQVRAVSASTRLSLVVVFSTGLALAAGIAFMGHMATADVFILLAWAVGAGVVSSLVASGALWLARNSGVITQAAIASLAPVLVVAIGVAGAARAMFIAGHDLWVLSVV